MTSIARRNGCGTRRQRWPTVGVVFGLALIVTVAISGQARAEVKVENAVPVDSSALLEAALCVMKANPGQCVRQQAARVLTNWEDILNTKKMEMLAEADKEVTAKQQSRGLSDAEIARGKPSTLMEQIETGLTAITEFVSDGVDEYVDDKRQEKAEEAATSKTHLHHLLKLGKRKGKKKKTFMKLFILGAALKAKIELLLKILSFKLQLKFFAVALIGLLINIARFWIDFKKQPHPQKVIYYEHAQHQHHYDDHGDRDFGGYWKRSLHAVNDDESYQGGHDRSERYDEPYPYRSPKYAPTGNHYAPQHADPHAMAYQQQRPY